MSSNPLLPAQNIYKPSGKGTLISDLIKRNHDTDNNSIQEQTLDNYKGIKKLADDVNISLQELEKSERKRKHINYKNISEYSEPSNELNFDEHQDNDSVSVETVEFYNDYVNIFIEMLLLLTVYVVMSQPFVISNIAKYVHQLNPTENGVIKLTGIIIYGIILTSLFVVVRHIVLKNIK